MMKCKDFLDKAYLALEQDTLYVKGGFGAPGTAFNKARYSNSLNSNRLTRIQNATMDTFFFDCVCLIKGILWGWNADKYDRNGGAVYKSHGVPDVNADGIILMAPKSSEDFSQIIPGAMVWMPGHVGIYMGDGLVIEATAAWGGKVLMSACANVGHRKGYPSRAWKKWGTIPWVDYTEEDDMTYEKFAEYMNRYLDERKTLPADLYAIDALRYMQEQGLMVGDGEGNQMPQSFVKREELAVIIKAVEDKHGR